MPRKYTARHALREGKARHYKAANKSSLRYILLSKKIMGHNAKHSESGAQRLLSVFACKNVSKHRFSTGIDIVPVPRFQKAIDKKSFLARNFTKNEITYCNNKHNSAVHFAGKFAAKEAVSKALKLEWKEGLNWKEIEIVNEENGAPFAVLYEQVKKIFDRSKYTELQISISHCDEYAVAVAVVL